MPASTFRLDESLALQLARGDELRKAGKVEQAIQAYLEANVYPPQVQICLRLARCYEQIGNYREAYRSALAVVDAGDDFTSWQSASALLQRCASSAEITPRRSARVAIVGSYTTIQLAHMLRLAASRLGISLELYESQFGQYQQDIIDPNSQLYAFSPDFVVLIVHEGDLRLPEYSQSSRPDVEAEVRRWTALWQTIKARSKARVVQFNFALPCELAMGHLGTRLPGSRYMMTHAVNTRIGEEAGAEVSIVDCERLSALVGKQRWYDPRYWHLSKQAVALDMLPLLARHTMAVISADLGLSRKCLVIDLDNTLWGGVIAEEGLAGIKLGNGVDGEAFVAFQDYVLKLKNRGIILAVCSKNNYQDAILPFEHHPEMRIKLDDIAVFVANWEPKYENIRTIATRLNIGLDSMVFADDNPVECAAMRNFAPEVDVIPLPADPSDYVRTLSQYLLFEGTWFTPEDAKRTEQYRARASAVELEASTTSTEDFYRTLHMKAIVAPFDELHLPRIAQLIGKTNQFNLTTRRHGLPQLQAFMKDPNCVHLCLRLRDRFTDHGLVSLLIALRHGVVLDIDTWLMSCRVIGRTVEATMLEHLCRRAEELGCSQVRGTYISTGKNAMAADMYGKLGFDLIDQHQDGTIWSYDLDKKGGITNEFIQAVDSWETFDGRS